MYRTGVVFPLKFRDERKDLRAHLHRRYAVVALPKNLAEKYEVFSLPND